MKIITKSRNLIRIVWQCTHFHAAFLSTILYVFRCPIVYISISELVDAWKVIENPATEKVYVIFSCIHQTMRYSRAWWSSCFEKFAIVHTICVRILLREKKVWSKTFPFELLKLQLNGSVVGHFLENYLKRKVMKKCRQKGKFFCVGGNRESIVKENTGR